MKFWVSRSLVVFSCCFSFVVLGGKLEERLNKILYWRISDELKLDPKTEAKLVETLEKLRFRRENALKERVQSFSEMKACEDERKNLGQSIEEHLKTHPEHKKQVDQSLDRYLQSGKELQQVDIDEYEKVVELLGKDKTLRFLVIRKNMADELKSALKK